MFKKRQPVPVLAPEVQTPASVEPTDGRPLFDPHAPDDRALLSPWQKVKQAAEHAETSIITHIKAAWNRAETNHPQITKSIHTFKAWLSKEYTKFKTSCAEHVHTIDTKLHHLVLDVLSAEHSLVKYCHELKTECGVLKTEVEQWWRGDPGVDSLMAASDAAT